eukprot:754191-Hanusia_phi.AAC.13
MKGGIDIACVVATKYRCIFVVKKLFFVNDDPALRLVSLVCFSLIFLTFLYCVFRSSCDVRLCDLKIQDLSQRKEGNLVITRRIPSAWLHLIYQTMTLVSRCITKSLLFNVRNVWNKGVHGFQYTRPIPGNFRTFFPSFMKNAKYEGELPKLGTNEFVVFSPEVSGREATDLCDAWS